MTNTAFTPPTGYVSDDTIFNSPGRWTNGSLARFFQGGWQIKHGWERLTLDNLGGVCRSTLPWTDAADTLNIAFGLHNGLKAWQGGTVWDITPQVVHPITKAETFAGNNIIRIEEPGHWHKVGDLVTIAGVPNPLGGVNVNGTFTVAAVQDPLVWSYLNTVNSGASANTVVGGMTVTTNMPPGSIDGTGGRGYGTGAYGVGNYSEPSADSYFPRTWSLAVWGSQLLANPRADTIYFWDAVTPHRAIPLAGAPAKVTYMVVTPSRQVMALGCNEEVGGVFNPLAIRWSDIEDYNDWTTASNNNAGEWILESGGRIVCGRVVGDYVFVWTTVALFLGTFIGAPGQTWKFEKIGDHCGAISPGAPIVKSQNVAWISPDRVFWSCSLGGQPQPMDCPIRSMFVDHITAGQDDKIVGSSVATYGELSWFWPDDRDGFENSRIITLSPDGWSRDILARSAYADTGPQPLVIGVAPTGQAYWQEKGHSADGGVLTGFIESGDFYLDEAQGGVMLNGMWPDFKGQIGSLNMTIFTREFPQSTQRAHGPWPLAPGQPKRSFRVSGRIARVRFDWSSAPAYARGGKPEFDVQGIGGR